MKQENDCQGQDEKRKDNRENKGFEETFFNLQRRIYFAANLVLLHLKNLFCGDRIAW